MIEIVFSESAGGSLRVAQHFGEGPCPGGVTSVFLTGGDSGDTELAKQQAEQDYRREWEAARPMGGRPEDVCVLPLALSVGDISEEIPGEERLQAMMRTMAMTQDQAREVLAAALRSLQNVMDRSAAGEGVRIWCSAEPDEMCGLYWILAQLAILERQMGPVSIVRLPQFEQRSEEKAVNGARMDRLIQRSGWGDVLPGEWSRFLYREVQVSPLLARVAARRWNQLQTENAPLRAVLNGNLVSMPEDIYDSFVRSQLNALDSEFQEAVLIGNVLSQCWLGIGDGLIAERIQVLIDRGEIEVVREADGAPGMYTRILRRK